MIDLSPEHLALVRDLLAHHIPDRKVAVFGSRAKKGAAKPFSDLDLCIMGEAPLSAATLADLREALSESRLPFKVDIVDWADTSDSFRKIIAAQAVEIGDE